MNTSVELTKVDGIRIGAGIHRRKLGALALEGEVSTERVISSRFSSWSHGARVCKAGLHTLI